MKTTLHTMSDDTPTIGFWLYLMTDCLLFASLFATYAVLRGNTAGGATSYEIFNLPYVLVETIILLTSSLTSGLALLMARHRSKRYALLWLGITMLLALAFLALELREFSLLLSEGHSWQTSAFLSAFFTLVGTHGAHITAGLLWAGTLVWVVWRRGLTSQTVKKIGLFALFWHFLDIIWIFIFTFVYAMGVL